MSRRRLTGGRAFLAARDTEEVETHEIERLATAAGYEVVGRLTQRRREDRTYNLGAGKARELADRVAETGADAVIFDGRLTPGQHGDLLALLPEDTRVIDRYRLVLEIFAAGAGEKRARRQVELATLEYELPRIRQTTDEGALNTATESGSVVYDVRDRIDRLRTELDEIERRDAERREQRRESGFDLVALAGYTNAGKSTLLHRLADELDADELETNERDTNELDRGEATPIGNGPNGNENAGRPIDTDETETAATADRLFETLETTTRRATIDDRRTVVTDTVGLIDDLPHELVESFSATLGEIRDSDAVVAVVDASAPPDRFRRRAAVTFDTLAAGAGVVVPVLNKIDRLDDATLRERRETLAAVVGGDAATDADRETDDAVTDDTAESDTPTGLDGRTRDDTTASDTNTDSDTTDNDTAADSDTAAADGIADRAVAVSATEGTGIDALRERLVAVLPSETAIFRLPNGGDTQRFVSWCHDHGDTAVDYGDRVRVTFTANPRTVAEARRRADELDG